VAALNFKTVEDIVKYVEGQIKWKKELL
jgi:acyl carrier protein